MKDLSKEEKLELRIATLEHQIWTKSDDYGNKRWLRVKRTFIVLSAVVYLFLFMNGYLDSIKDYLLCLLVAPVVAGFIMLISYLVLFYIIDETVKEDKDIAKKLGELEALKFIKYE